MHDTVKPGVNAQVLLTNRSSLGVLDMGAKLVRVANIYINPLLGWVVWKSINNNPGLKVDGRFSFFCIRVFFITFVLWSLRLVEVKTRLRTDINRKLHWKVKNLKSKFILIQYLNKRTLKCPAQLFQFSLKSRVLPNRLKLANVLSLKYGALFPKRRPKTRKQRPQT